VKREGKAIGKNWGPQHKGKGERFSRRMSDAHLVISQKAKKEEKREERSKRRILSLV